MGESKIKTRVRMGAVVVRRRWWEARLLSNPNKFRPCRFYMARVSTK